MEKIMNKIEILDLFCGVGGLTCGLKKAGLNVLAGFDLDNTCKYAYEINNHVTFVEANIREVTANEVNKYYSKNAIKVMVGCAPCQPFSQMQFKKCEDHNYVRNDKYDLLLEYGRLINECLPDIVSMENVPRIKDTDVYQEFLKILKDNNYFIDAKVVYCPEYGIAQNRRRFVLVASRLGEVHLIPPTHNCNDVTVRQFIGDLPPVASGEINELDPMHRTAQLSQLNLRRIRCSIPGGSWKDWPEDLRCECHRKQTGQTYTSVYGRMRWDAIGPTMTTQFYCYGTGRYGHPEQDRALTLREGALLQTFPRNYNFINPDVGFKMKDIARHLGNAVPVRLGEIVGQSIIQHLSNCNID